MHELQGTVIPVRQGCSDLGNPKNKINAPPVSNKNFCAIKRNTQLVTDWEKKVVSVTYQVELTLLWDMATARPPGKEGPGFYSQQWTTKTRLIKGSGEQRRSWYLWSWESSEPLPDINCVSKNQLVDLIVTNVRGVTRNKGKPSGDQLGAAVPWRNINQAGKATPR